MESGRRTTSIFFSDDPCILDADHTAALAALHVAVGGGGGGGTLFQPGKRCGGGGKVGALGGGFAGEID